MSGIPQPHGGALVNGHSKMDVANWSLRLKFHHLSKDAFGNFAPAGAVYPDTQ